MTLDVSIPIINQRELTIECLKNLQENAEEDYGVIIIDNGSNPPVVDLPYIKKGHFIRNEQNIGLPKSLNQAWKASKADYIFYTHNDVMVYEKGWDTKIKRILEQNYDVGVAGFYGAKGIGTSDLYRTPYQMQQLIRIENVSGCYRMNAAIHGFRPPIGETEDVCVMDGFSLIVKRELLVKVGGFDEKLPSHHMYDNDICLESLRVGYRNIVIAMDAEHYGGRTDVLENWNEGMGKSKAEIHADAHYPYFYEKWRGFIPKRVA